MVLMLCWSKLTTQSPKDFGFAEGQLVTAENWTEAGNVVELLLSSCKKREPGCISVLSTLGSVKHLNGKYVVAQGEPLCGVSIVITSAIARAARKVDQYAGRKVIQSEGGSFYVLLL